MQWEAQSDYWDEHPMSREVPAYWCDGKRRYESQAHAMTSLITCWGGLGRSDPRYSNTTYYCTTCCGYHIGSMSIKGVSTGRNWVRFRKGGRGHHRKARRP